MRREGKEGRKRKGEGECAGRWREGCKGPACFRPFFFGEICWVNRVGVLAEKCVCVCLCCAVLGMMSVVARSGTGLPDACVQPTVD